MSEYQAITGHELVRNIFRFYCDDPVKKLIEEIAKGETEYLELKATCVFDKNAPGNKGNETQHDLSWNIARELFALYNTKGGALILGITDKFETCPLPNFKGQSQNDYLRMMIKDKIFPNNYEWRTKNGTEIYTCDKHQAEVFIRNSLHIEYSCYKGNTVAVLFVDPAPCTEDACIQIEWKKNNGDPYDQLPVRQPGNTGGVKNITQYKDKNTYQETRKRTDPEFGRIWAQHAPSPEFKTTRAKTAANQPATAYNSTDPESDRLTRAIDGRELEYEFPPNYILNDRYRIIKKIGQGGMGIVYEVEHIDLKVRRALKVFAPNEPSDLLKRKFLSEARLLARFKHPGLVKVHNIDVTNDSTTLFYEMDLVTSSNDRPMSFGEIYRNLNNSKGPSNIKLREWFAQLCNVLQYLHKTESIVHRDIKLENVLLNSKDMAVLSDFGIARIKNCALREELCDQMTMHTASPGSGDANIGTPEYLAPELETEKATAKSDNYALGVMFFKLLTGQCYTHQTGSDLQTALKGKARFWRKTLPKFLAHNPKNRIENLSKYAIKNTYPGLGLPHLFNKIFLVYIIVVSVILFGIATQSKILTEWSYNGITVHDFFSEETSPRKNENKTADINEPSPSQEQQMTVHSNDKNNAEPVTKPDRTELKTAKADLLALNNHFIDIKKIYSLPPNASDNDDISQQIRRLHENIFMIWKETKELTELGMQPSEVVAARLDLVEKCVRIRQDAIRLIDKTIASAEYKKALSLYTAINNEFRNCGFREIPRPSFTPPKP